MLGKICEGLNKPLSVSIAILVPLAKKNVDLVGETEQTHVRIRTYSHALKTKEQKKKKR